MQGEMIFLDTSFIIAFFNRKDRQHSDARQIVAKTLENSEDILFIYSDYIFDEAITLWKSKKLPTEKIVQIGKRLLNSHIWKLVIVREEHFFQSWQQIQTYQDKMWSFTDVTSFVLMEEMGVKHYLSYDHHFAQNPKIQLWYPQ